jgi:stage II sporulation protein M
MSEQDLPDDQPADNQGQRASQIVPGTGIADNGAERDLSDTRDAAVLSHPKPAEEGGEQRLSDPREISRAPDSRDDGSRESVPVSRPLRDSFRQMGPWLLVVACLFALTMLAGVIVAIRDPSIGTTLMNIFRETILDGIDESNPFALAFAIFLNNLQACILLFLGGASFGILTVFILGSNGLVIGAVLELVRQEKGALFVIAAILPHGIFEIPAFLISGALGLMLARSLMREWHGLEDAAAAATRSGRLFITVVVPVIVLAAFIEAFITPQIIELVI